MDASDSHEADLAFSQARRRVFFHRIWSFLTGSQDESLLSFERVRHKLNIQGQHYVGLQVIPMDKVVGTVGRYQEFNRAFLPTQEHIRERWKRIYTVAHKQGFPPIDVYKIGDVYFVRDGHHRVSVLKELGATTVEATVTELDSPVSLAPDVSEADLDLKAEYAFFLHETKLERLHLDPGIEFTLPGQYQKLLEHIAVHRHFLGLREQREIPQTEACARWYDEVYRPVVKVIYEEAILDEFPERTEADLYLWIIEHRHYLNERYGHEVPLKQAAAEFSTEFSSDAGKKQLENGGQKARPTPRSRRGRTIAVFGSGRPAADHPVLAQAQALGQMLAEAGFTLMNGGYGGVMEAASRGARLAGGQVIGVTMDLFEASPNPWLTKERRVKDFFPRLQQLTSADGFVVLRGGVGTLTEATLTWTLLQTGQISRRPLVFVGSDWQHLFQAFQALTFVTQDDLALVTVVETVDDVLAVLEEALAPSP